MKTLLQLFGLLLLIIAFLGLIITEPVIIAYCIYAIIGMVQEGATFFACLKLTLTYFVGGICWAFTCIAIGAVGMGLTGGLSD